MLKAIERKESREEGYEGFTLDELAREGLVGCW